MEQIKSRVLILGGTSEGRELSRFAHDIGLSATVSVVSGYGAELLEDTRYVKVHQGALDREEMERFFEWMKPELVLDATHPYACLLYTSRSGRRGQSIYSGKSGI